MYKFYTLSNGLQLITVPMRGTKTATILVMVRTGSKYETKANNGVSHFLEHMLFKGTKKRPDTLAISSELDNLGGIYNAFTAKEYMGYWAKSDAKKIEESMDVVSDILLNSKFASDEIKREKGVIIEEFNMYQDNPIMYIEDVFEQCLYGDQPAGWDTLGAKENITRFKRHDLVNYLRQQYGAQSTIICLAGDISLKKGRKLVQNHFSSFAYSDWQDKLRVKEKQRKPAVTLKYKKTDQVHLSLGVRTFSSSHKNKYITKVMAALLGGAMSSRLFLALRERRGLAYYVRTSTEFYTDTGYLTTQAGVPIAKMEQAIKIILAEYRKLKTMAVPQEELERIIKMLVGKTVIFLEASDNMANWYCRQAVMDEEVLTPARYFKKIEAVKAGDIKRVARDIFVDQGLNLAMIGPCREDKRFKELLKL